MHFCVLQSPLILFHQSHCPSHFQIHPSGKVQARCRWGLGEFFPHWQKWQPNRSNDPRPSLLAGSLSPRKSARCFLKLSISCFVLSSETEIRALYLSIGFSSPLRYMLMTAFTILDIVLCKSKWTAIARSCEVTREDWRLTTPEVLIDRTDAGFTWD